MNLILKFGTLGIPLQLGRDLEHLTPRRTHSSTHFAFGWCSAQSVSSFSVPLTLLGGGGGTQRSLLTLSMEEVTRRERVRGRLACATATEAAAAAAGGAGESPELASELISW